MAGITLAELASREGEQISRNRTAFVRILQDIGPLETEWLGLNIAPQDFLDLRGSPLRFTSHLHNPKEFFLMILTRQGITMKNELVDIDSDPLSPTYKRITIQNADGVSNLVVVGLTIGY